MKRTAIEFARLQDVLRRARRWAFRVSSAGLALSLLLAMAAPTAAQPQVNQLRQGFVQLNLQGEVPLKALIDLVSQRLNVNVIYSEEIGNRTITVRAPNEIPASSLLDLLGSVLRMERLALVGADIPGWKRIIDAREMLGLAETGEAKQVLAANGPATPVTQVFALKHAAADQVATAVRPFLSKVTQGTGGSSILALRESNMIVVTDYAPTVVTVEKLIRLIDQPRGNLVYEFYTVEHTDATALAEKVQGITGTRRAAVTSTTQASRPAELLVEPRTNQIAVVGPRTLVDEILLLLKRFDVSLGRVTRVYRVENTQAERFDRIIKGFLSAQDAERLYTSSVDRDGNLLIVRTTPEIHDRIDELKEQIDVPVKATQTPIRFYKLKNANSLDVLYTILSLQEVSPQAGVYGAGFGGFGGFGGPGLPGQNFPGYGPGPYQQAPSIQGGGLNVPRNLGPSPSRTQRLNQFPNNSAQPLSLPMTAGEGLSRPIDSVQQTRSDRLSNLAAPQFGFAASATLPGGARASADPATNSIVVVAPLEAQEMYKRLIESLDVRKPQVLIDAKIVAVDTTDAFTLGVEISGGDRQGDSRLLGFTSFGLSEVDPTTGALQLLPMSGFNGTLVNPEVADVVVKALASHTRARVLASPRILVNDNSTGQLESVSSVPFESVNSANTISTTSLGGNQQAGTLITVTPHISEDDHLLLEFSVEFSTFTGDPIPTTGGGQLPPPRQIDRVGSTVTVPDGQTVIVGGLQRNNESYTLRGIPYLEKIPVIRDLSTFRNKGLTTTSFFLFIRPIILRADRFEDLKHLSGRTVRIAEIGGDYPMSQPLLVE